MRSTIFFLVTIFSVVAFSQKRKDRSGTVIPLTQEDSVQFEAVIVEAEKQLILENYAKALESFSKALEMNNQSGAVNFKIAEVLRMSKENQKAIPYCVKAVELNPNNKYYLLALAKLYKSVGYFDDAAKTFETVLVKYPTDEATFRELAKLYMDLGRFDEMFRTFDKMEAQLGVDVEIVRERQRILMNSRNIDAVIAEYRKLIDAYSNESLYQLELIDFLIQNRKPELATAEIASYEKNHGSNSRLTLLNSELKWMNGDREAALSLLEQAIKGNNLDFEFKLHLLTNFLTITSRAEDKKKIGRDCSFIGRG